MYSSVAGVKRIKIQAIAGGVDVQEKKMSEGKRVIAISHTDGDIIYSYGEGTLLGDLHPKDFSEENQPVGSLAEMLMEEEIENPCIKLDNGNIIWGCECWWGSVGKIKKELEQYKEVRQIDIKEQRDKYKE